EYRRAVCEPRWAGRAEQLGGAVADHQALLVDAERVRELGAQLVGAAVEVAVQAAASGVGDRVDDRGRRVRGARLGAEIYRLAARERLPAALGRRVAQLCADLLLGHAL